MGQVHAQDRIARFQDRKIGRHVGGAARVGLNVGVVRPEQGLGPFDGEFFRDIHLVAAAIVALAGIAFGVFIGHYRAHRVHDRGRAEILRRDQFQAIALPVRFRVERGSNLRVGFQQRFRMKGVDGHRFVQSSDDMNSSRK